MAHLPTELFDEILFTVIDFFHDPDDREAYIIPVLSDWRGLNNLDFNRGNAHFFSVRLIQRLPNKKLVALLRYLPVEDDVKINRLCQALDFNPSLSKPLITITRIEGEGPEKLSFSKQIVQVGRRKENDLQIKDDTVSRYHGEIHFAGGDCHYNHLGSNPTRLYSKANRSELTITECTGHCSLFSGDQLKIGSYKFEITMHTPGQNGNNDSDDNNPTKPIPDDPDNASTKPVGEVLESKEPQSTSKPMPRLEKLLSWTKISGHLHNGSKLEFWIRKYPVTNREYAQFISESGYRPAPSHWGNNKENPPQRLDFHPVTHVSYDDASAFCAWFSRKNGYDVKLPTDEEWKQSGRVNARDQRQYPWGDGSNPNPNNCNVADSRMGGTTEVDFYDNRDLDLANEVFDLIGNVWEWTYKINENQASIKGGAFNTGFYSLSRAESEEKSARREDIGFRIITHDNRDPEERDPEEYDRVPLIQIGEDMKPEPIFNRLDLTVDEKIKLVQVLIVLNSLKNQSKLQILLNHLTFQGKLSINGLNLNDLTLAIIDTALKEPSNGMKELFNTLKSLEGDTIPLRNVIEVWNDIQTNKTEGDDDETKIANDRSIRSAYVEGWEQSVEKLGEIDKRWAFLVGVNEYTSSYANLSYCEADILTLAETLKTNGYHKVYTMHKGAKNPEDQPVSYKVKDKLKLVCRAVNPIKENPVNLLFIHFSCHGDIVDDTGEPVLILKDTEADRIIDSSIALKDIISIVQEAKIQRCIISLDACHMGVKAGGRSGNTKFIQRVNKEAQGLIVLTASTRKQKAIETGEEISQGIYSFYLNKALQGEALVGNLVTVDSAYNYVLVQVQEWIADNNGGLQIPTIDKKGWGDMPLIDKKVDNNT